MGTIFCSLEQECFFVLLTKDGFFILLTKDGFFILLTKDGFFISPFPSLLPPFPPTILPILFPSSHFFLSSFPLYHFPLPLPSPFPPLPFFLLLLISHFPNKSTPGATRPINRGNEATQDLHARPSIRSSSGDFIFLPIHSNVPHISMVSGLQLKEIINTLNWQKTIFCHRSQTSFRFRLSQPY